MNVINLPLSPGNMLDLSEGRDVRTVCLDVDQPTYYRVRIDGEWRKVW